MVIAGVTGIKQAGKGVLVMTQVPVHGIDHQVEQQQGQRYRQPFEGLYLLQRAPEQADRGDPEHQHKPGVQPRIVEAMDISAITVTKRLRGLPHPDHLLSLSLTED